MEFTKAQKLRLRNLGSDADLNMSFDSPNKRDEAFRNEEKAVIRKSRALLASMCKRGDPTLVSELTDDISSFLRGKGFLEVSTPIIIPKTYLERMTIDNDHALHDQVFWLDSKSCLRPMLAPGLYSVSKRLIDILGKPVGVFEVGPCFRKESQGARHLSCFTMVNFVEWGVSEERKVERAGNIIAGLMNLLALDYRLVEEDSVVYGKTFDVVVGGIELASGAFGPHPLDSAWGIEGTWFGVGMGIERAVCLREGIDNIQRVGRSFTYHNGVSLNFK